VNKAAAPTHKATAPVAAAKAPASKVSVQVIDSLGAAGLSRRISFGCDDVKRFFKKVPPSILSSSTSSTKDMLEKTAGKGLLKRK